MLNCENEHIHDIHDSATVHQNNYIETIKTRINDKLTLLMAKLEDSKNVQALLSAESNIDTALSVLHVLSRSPCNSTMTSIEQTPPNKHIQQQRHFFSTKRKRKTKIRIAKPSKEERRDIQRFLLSDLPLYSSETSLASAAETTEAQTSKICHVHAYIIYSTQVL